MAWPKYSLLKYLAPSGYVPTQLQALKPKQHVSDRPKEADQESDSPNLGRSQTRLGSTRPQSQTLNSVMP